MNNLAAGQQAIIIRDHTGHPLNGAHTGEPNYGLQSTLNEVRAATEELLIATTRDLDAAKTAARHAESVAKFYLKTIEVDRKIIRETSHRADILAQRCAEQARMIAQLLAKYEPAPNHPGFPDSSPHPIHAAVATMQRQGVR